MFTKAPPPRTEFDKLSADQTALQTRIERFEAREDKIRDLATLKGQRQARRRLRKISRSVFGQELDPQDIKVLFHPVEYLAFRGLTDGNCTALEFIDVPPSSKERETIQSSLAKAIEAGNIEWQTLRVEDAGRIVAEPKPTLGI